jgi:uncharacterized membrane protein YfcA
MGTILIGSLPGVVIGTQLIGHVPATALRPALGCVLLASALGVMSKAGAEVPPTVLIGVPLAVGAGAWLVQRARRPVIGAEAEVSPA